MTYCENHYHPLRVISDDEQPHFATRYCLACTCAFCDTCAEEHDAKYPERKTVEFVQTGTPMEQAESRFEREKTQLAKVEKFINKEHFINKYARPFKDKS